MPRWYFSYRFVDEFAQGVVEELARVLPADGPKSDKAKTVAKHQQKNDRAVDLVRRKVAEFGKAQKLNLFQRARLTKRLQDGLLERGYPIEVAKAIAMEALPQF